MDGQSFDKLYLDIAVNNKGTTRTINAVTKSLDRLTASISAFDSKGLYKKFDSLFRILNNANATGFADLTKNLTGVANAFSKITNASKIDTKGLYAKFNSLTRIITPFVDKVKEGETSLVALAQTLKSVKAPTSTGGGKTSNGGTNKNQKDNLNIFATMGKWNYIINMARYYGQSLANIVQLSMDYVETQNLWQVANRNNLEMAEEFIQKMNKAYGVSEATLMNYQAIFKNMLSALGDLSDEISSGLSQQLTQMALDFSSLYNVTIPSAMQKFQAVLSGQVRPIRSISGYDITENTIFDLYTGAGGQKTMRQLSQIEKRLLRIVAVFDQMGATGATGDMAKTIESASNQARILSEQAKETLTWIGQLVLMWMDSVGLLQHINAFLITMKEIMRAIAYDMGYSDKNFLDGLVTSAEEANEAIEEIQGKLLSFDKFSSLNSNQDNSIGIDQTVLELLKKVNYQTEEFTMKAQEMASEWLKSIDFIDENGDGIADITQKARDLLDVLKSVGVVVGTLIGYNLTTKIVSLTAKLTGLVNAISLLNASLAVGVVYTILKAVEAFKQGDIWGGILATTIGVLLAGAFLYLNKTIVLTITKSLGRAFMVLLMNATLATGSFAGAILSLSGGFLGLAGSIAGAFILIKNWGDMNTWQKIIGIIGVATTAILGLALAFGAFHSAWSLGLASAGIASGIGMIVASMPKVPAYATGGFPEDGLFFANSGEMVGGFSNGKTAVANNDQIVEGIAKGVELAVYRAVKAAMSNGGSGDIVLRLDGKELARANVNNNAMALSSNYRIELQPR